MKAAILQMTSGDVPEANLQVLEAAARDAAEQGAAVLATPEVTNCVSLDRALQQEVLCVEADDPVLKGAREIAKAHGLWVALGSLALKAEAGEKLVNRSFMIAPTGEITARYDKIHMFDVQISEAETYRESARFQAGNRAVMAEMDGVKTGLTICYDLRFPYLFNILAQCGAQVIMVPAAFSPLTGAAHWEPLLRARAIETGCFIIASAQSGTHPARVGQSRKTWGHSLVVSPWGEVLLDAGEAPGLHVVDLDLEKVAEARRRVPSLSHQREISGACDDTD